ncbi:MAG: hypothetical protein KTR21_00370 [Rhodobacteraceae bacterium]|nr:hypothetical protein [Paracoccaceae bacterium]
MPLFLPLFTFNPLAEAASAMGSGSAGQAIDEALDEGFYPPEAEERFVLSGIDNDNDVDLA